MFTEAAACATQGGSAALDVVTLNCNQQRSQRCRHLQAEQGRAVQGPPWFEYVHYFCRANLTHWF